jgi:tRNA(fMet)-specific endonuclease VapC
MYILDTNTLIHFFFEGVERVADRMLNVLRVKTGIPSVVLYEMEYGLMKSQSPDKQLK